MVFRTWDPRCQLPARYSHRDGHRVTYRAATLPVPEATRQHNWQLSRKAPARPYRAQVYSRSQVTPKYKSLRGNSGWYSAHGTPAVSFQPGTHTTTPTRLRCPDICTATPAKLPIAQPRYPHPKQLGSITGNLAPPASAVPSQPSITRPVPQPNLLCGPGT